jgi:AraC-like DNA-binding protein
MTEALNPPRVSGGSSDAATIPVRYAREALSQLRLDEPTRARILQASGVAPRLLRDARHRLTREQFERVYRHAIRAGGDESLGYAARPVPPGGYAFLVASLARCADLAACLEQSNAFHRLFDPRGGWELSSTPSLTTLRLAVHTRAQAGSILFLHSMLLTPSRTAAWLVGRTLPLSGLTLPARFRPFAGETRFLFGIAPDFGTIAEIRFASRQLELPVVRSPRDVASYLRASLRGFLLGAAGDPVEQRVRNVLAEWKPFADAGIEQVARRLATSRPTLARHLQRIGTSFAALREELRRDFAIGLLGRGLRVADVAERLGYSEPSAFQRAFKTWTGTTPGRYLLPRTDQPRSAASVAATSSSVL